MTPELPSLQALFTGGVWSVFALLLLALVKAWPALRKLSIEGDQSMRGDLLKRINELEARESVFDKKLESVTASYEAELKILRHRLNNVTAAFNALLLLIKNNPDKAAEAVAQIEEMRRQQEATEAAEKAIIAGARIQAAAMREDQ